MKPDKKILNVFLDTEVFMRNNFNILSGNLFKIILLAAEKRLKLILTDITVLEIENNIKKEVDASKQALMSFKNKGKILKNCTKPSLKYFFNEFDSNEVTDNLMVQFHAFISSSKALVLNANDVSVKEVFDKYFKSLPPFNKGSKKSEFPDAFAFGVIEKWCADNKENIIIVSGDPDWEKASELNDSFLYFRTIQEFLDYIHKEELKKKTLKLIYENENEISKSVKEQFLNLGFLLENVNGNVNDIKVLELKLLDPYLVDVGKLTFIFNLLYEIQYVAYITIEDYSFASYDKEDNRYYNVKEVEEKVNDVIELYVNVEIKYDEMLKNGKISNIELESHKDISIIFDEDDGWPYK